MPTATQPDFTAADTWSNLVDTIGAAASVNVLLQNKGNGVVRVVFGGSQPTSKDAGLILKTFDSVQGNAAAIWLRSSRFPGVVGVTVL